MKKSVLKICCLIFVYIAISLGLYFILKACGLTNVSKIRDLVSKYGVWSYLIFFVFQIMFSTFICIVPFEDELLVMCAIVLFGPIKGFVVGVINMMATSILQFVIGRYFCRGVLAKLLGVDSVSRYENYLKVKGEIMLPLLYAIPLFPHDSLCILAGMSKMRVWYFALVTLIMRSIEIAEICFLGSGIIDLKSFGIIDWMFFINLIIVDIYLIVKLHKYIENKINKKQNK